ncbi:hypothetical protein [Nonomuraea candida]|uniref:hypothetical protein n=1 Tax=Nonomuraea candida TaxID=359159 RepID=UPI0005BC0EC8|nr:hypothetical protein [Nonomuraea candida]
MSQSRPHRVRGLAVAVVVAGLAVPFLASTGSAETVARPAAPPAAAPAAAATAVLKCDVRTAPQHPIVFTPALRDAAARHTEGQGVLLLENCTSPSGTITDIRSGRLEVSGSATASCRSVADLAATGNVTWRNGQGTSVGTSTLTASHPGSATLADNLLSGTVAAGRLKGRSFSGTGTMTSDLNQCTTPAGFTQLTGTGQISFT